jgi:hypothetical protein
MLIWVDNLFGMASFMSPLAIKVMYDSELVFF